MKAIIVYYKNEITGFYPDVKEREIDISISGINLSNQN